MHIFPIYFHLNHNKSYSCYQVYIKIGIYHNFLLFTFTAQKVKFFIKNFLWNRWHLLKQSLMENVIFCAVFVLHTDLK